MTNENVEAAPVEVSEQVVLQKFEGPALPENEFERITIKDGTIVAHEKVKDKKVIGPVEDSEIVGAEVGRLMAESQKEVE